jgi:adenylate kinase
MSLTEWFSVSTAVLAVAVAVAGIVRDRRKPELDAAQAESAIVNSSSVKQQIKRMSDESNMRRDLRILDLENWADLMRPWASRAKERDDLIFDTIREDRRRLGLEMPHFPALPPVPAFPPPRPL